MDYNFVPLGSYDDDKFFLPQSLIHIDSLVKFFKFESCKVITRLVLDYKVDMYFHINNELQDGEKKIRCRKIYFSPMNIIEHLLTSHRIYFDIASVNKILLDHPDIQHGYKLHEVPNERIATHENSRKLSYGIMSLLDKTMTKKVSLFVQSIKIFEGLYKLLIITLPRLVLSLAKGEKYEPFSTIHDGANTINTFTFETAKVFINETSARYEIPVTNFNKHKEVKGKRPTVIRGEIAYELSLGGLSNMQILHLLHPEEGKTIADIADQENTVKKWIKTGEKSLEKQTE